MNLKLRQPSSNLHFEENVSNKSYCNFELKVGQHNHHKTQIN
jgi:hypothetical protein